MVKKNNNNEQTPESLKKDLYPKSVQIKKGKEINHNSKFIKSDTNKNNKTKKKITKKIKKK